MVSKKNLELLEKIADLCNQASEEMEDTEGTNEILCLCDELVEKITLWKKSMLRGNKNCLGLHSRLAYDGSGRVLRGTEADLPVYSLCRFQNGKVYNCDLSASYNIGSRYLVREILKSLPARERLVLEVKIPQAAKRSTCTWPTLINLNAELMFLGEIRF